MKILIVPDSFKGSMTSKQVCESIKQGIMQTAPDSEIECIEFADGGEGFAECLSNMCNGNKLYTTVTDIYANSINSYINYFNDTAVIDCAQASGIQAKKQVMNATSHGTGELIKFAVSNGFKNIILGLGGSGCCDGGAGILNALGAEFYDIYGEIIASPKGCDLNKISRINFDNIVKGINFTYACDVTNPLFGKNGAAYVFAPQKGADKSQVKELDKGLRHLNALLPCDVSNIIGGGAAGGICAGLYSVYGGKIESGFDILSSVSHLEEKIINSDIIVTGEGKTDEQTLYGKLPYKIAMLCKKYNKKCVVISGSIENVKFADKMISIVDNETTLSQAMKNPQETLKNKSKLILQ